MIFYRDNSTRPVSRAAGFRNGGGVGSCGHRGRTESLFPGHGALFPPSPVGCGHVATLARLLRRSQKSRLCDISRIVPFFSPWFYAHLTEDVFSIADEGRPCHTYTVRVGRAFRNELICLVLLQLRHWGSDRAETCLAKGTEWISSRAVAGGTRGR